MPGNILNADTGFPQFTGNMTEEQKLNKVMNYLYMLLEQLRYTLANLDADNFNDTGLQEIADGIATPLLQTFNDGITAATAKIEGIATAAGSQIKLITDWIGVDEEGKLVSSAAEIRQQTNANAADIALLTQWKSSVTESIAAVEVTASQNEAKITSLTSWRSTAEGDIDDLYETTALLEQVANENGASISQIVQAVGKNGEVTAASIVTAVNSAGSSVKISAEHIDITGFVTFSNLAEDGESIINGNNISLIADAYGDSISELTFYKWRYTDDTEDDHTLDNMFRIRTVDNESDNDNYARYAAMIQTLPTYEDDTKYNVALKLLSNGAMSMESDYSIYMYADTYMTLEAYDNIRIRASRSYSAFTGDNVSADDYIFCTTGIYMDGVRVLNPLYEFTASGIYYDGELVVATP